MASYLESGYNKFFIRATYQVDNQVDNVNAEEIISGASIGSSQIANLAANKIIKGKFGLIPSSGNTGILFDADENRIVINDGSNDRIVLGRLVGKF